MGRSRWLGHPLTLVVAGSVALAAGAAIAVAAVGVVDPVPGGGGTTVSYPVRQLMIVGRVLAVNRESITLSAHGQMITAAITRSTRVTRAGPQRCGDQGRGHRVGPDRPGGFAHCPRHPGSRQHSLTAFEVPLRKIQG